MERDGMENMEQHLLFHKALIDDNVGAEKIDRYIGVLKDSGPTETMNDPVDESIRSAFSLVLEHNMDPWYIDLMEFTRMYAAKKMRSAVDIIVAGKLIHMAWKILRMQSDATLAEGERPDPFEVDELLTEFNFEEMYPADKLYVPDVEFSAAVRRNSVRPVTMMELLDAFEEARDEMEYHLAMEQAREAQKAKEPKQFSTKAHEEDDKRDVELVWERINKLGPGAIPLRDLFVNDIKANITTIVSVLHLVRDGRLTVWQDNLPYGEIFVEEKLEWINVREKDDRSLDLVMRAVV